jgi:hypothetical protein
MKKTLQLLGTFALVSILVTSCSSTEKPTDESKTPTSQTIEENTSTEVNAEINDSGEATVTITTNKNGIETIETLTGNEALAYIAKEELDMDSNSESSSSSTVIIKNQDGDEESIDIDEIMDSEEIKDLDAEVQARVKEGLQQANSEIEVRTEKSSKVIVIEK